MKNNGELVGLSFEKTGEELELKKPTYIQTNSFTGPF